MHIFATKQSPIQKSPGVPELSDVEEASIIFFKQWKLTEVSPKIKENFKGYHIDLALERVLPRHPENDKEVKESEVIFDVKRLKRILNEMAYYLQLAYNPKEKENESSLFNFNIYPASPEKQTTEFKPKRFFLILLNIIY